MKRLGIIVALSVTLAACSTAQIDATVKQVQGYAVTTCRFLPTVATVAAILSRASVVENTFSIAQQICTAVTTLPLAEGPGKRRAVVKGVVVQGRFVR